MSLRNFKFALSLHNQGNTKDSKQKDFSNQISSPESSDTVDLKSRKMSDFHKINLILKNFENPHNFQPEYTSDKKTKQIQQLIETANLFENDFNFQYRFLIIALRLGLKRNDLFHLGILQRVISSFKIYYDKEVFFTTGIEIFITQTYFEDAVKILKSAKLFHKIMEMATKNRIKGTILLKSYEILATIFEESCLQQLFDHNWLIDNGINCLILSRNWTESTKNTKTSHFLHFLVILSRFPVFLPSLASKLKLLLDGFGDFLLEILNLFDNMLNACEKGVYPQGSKDFLASMTRILLGKPGKAEIFVKTIAIFLKCFDLLNDNFFDENFVTNIVAVVKLHSDRKLITPITRSLLQAIYLRKQLKSASLPIKGKLKTTDSLSEVQLSVEGESNLLIKNGESSPRVIQLAEVKNVLLGHEMSYIPESQSGTILKPIPNYGFELTTSKASSIGNGYAELTLKMVKTAKREVEELFFYFVPSEKNLRVINPLVELLIRVRELNFD